MVDGLGVPGGLLLLTDIRTPKTDGCEAARAIRAVSRRSTAKLPIAAITANAFEEDVREALRAGMDAHIGKPADVERLIRALPELLRRDAKPAKKTKEHGAAAK